MSEKTDVWLLILADMEARRAKGLAEYGVPVTAGRDLKALLYWLRHRYGEVLDDAAYTRAVIETIENMLAAWEADPALRLDVLSERERTRLMLLARAERQEHLASPAYTQHSDADRAAFRHAAAMLRLAAAELEDTRNKV